MYVEFGILAGFLSFYYYNDSCEIDKNGHNATHEPSLADIHCESAFLLLKSISVSNFIECANFILVITIIFTMIRAFMRATRSE